jgi:uncharacterized protein YggE
MTVRNLPIRAFAITLFIFTVGLVVSYFFPWKNINWGIVTTNYQNAISVSGTSERREPNRVASYSAGVNAYNDNKDSAIAEVNSKITKITDAVKAFGIKAEDIQTQSLSIYQNQDYVYEGDRQKYKPGQWNVSNTISVILRDVKQASDLTSLLASSGATNIYGPNFSVEDTKDIENILLAEAIENAKGKAQLMVKSSGRTLGKVINISESGVASPIYYDIAYKGMGGGGGMPTEAGATTIQKTVNVTFELL